MHEDTEPNALMETTLRMDPLTPAPLPLAAARRKRWKPVAGLILLVCSVAGFLLSMGLCGMKTPAYGVHDPDAAGIVIFFLSLGAFLLGLVIMALEVLVWMVLKVRQR
jgi:hypothetical protein